MIDGIIHTSKWDLYPSGTIPLFLADMDLPTAPGIVAALTQAMGSGQ